MFKRFDESKFVGEFLAKLSTTLAVYRGLPMLVGTGLVIASLVTSLIVIPIIALSENTILFLLCIPTILFHLGTITALIGIMMSAPLGRGFHE